VRRAKRGAASKSRSKAEQPNKPLAPRASAAVSMHSQKGRRARYDARMLIALPRAGQRTSKSASASVQPLLHLHLVLRKPRPGPMRLQQKDKLATETVLARLPSTRMLKTEARETHAVAPYVLHMEFLAGAACSRAGRESLLRKLQVGADQPAADAAGEAEQHSGQSYLLSALLAPEGSARCPNRMPSAGGASTSSSASRAPGSHVTRSTVCAPSQPATQCYAAQRSDGCGRLLVIDAGAIALHGAAIADAIVRDAQRAARVGGAPASAEMVLSGGAHATCWPPGVHPTHALAQAGCSGSG
jgi:hypothetical protein